MAVAGSVVHAFRCWLEEGRLRMIPTSMLRDMCEAPDIAILMSRSGLVATVAGSDVDQVRMAVTKEIAK